MEFARIARITYFYPMGLCLQCKKWVKQPEGKREKKFCDDTCRSNYRHAKNRKKAVKAAITTPIVREVKKEVPQKGVEEWMIELDQADDAIALERVGKQIERSGLPGRDKEGLRNYGQQIFNKRFAF